MRDQLPLPEDPQEERGPRPGQLRPTPPAVLAAWGAVGIVVGWLGRPLTERVFGVSPTVSWVPALLFAFVAAILAGTARNTSRAMKGRTERPEAHRMVNRFVLGRATALVGAVMTGVYLGYAVAWLGISAELGGQRITRSLVAAVAALAMTVAAVALERACRISSEE